MQKLQSEKKIAIEFAERRYDDWNENYELYRNKVKTNRLTQRQAVNIPLIKETVKTLLSKIDDVPKVDWKDLGGDDQKELYFQEMWNNDFDRLNMEGIDVQDKKTNLLYGRSFKKLNWNDKGMDVRALDIFDIVVDPLADPLDLETARFLIHQNIFRSLRDILADDRYSEQGKASLKVWLSSPEGIIQSSKEKEQWEAKLDRLKSLGLGDNEFALFAGGDTIVNLTEHHSDIWNEKTKKFERKVIVYANDSIELLNESMMDLLGVDFYPFVTWAEDIETQDFWSDSVSDLLRVPNKVVNVWFSQLVENRTLRNFQMHWYDSTAEGFSPQTYEPGPGRMLPAPGDPNKTIMPVDVQGLDETLNAISFVTSIAERASGATAIEKGQAEQGQQTLGEIQILVGKATERIKTVGKAYRRSWKELAQKYQAIVDANCTAKMTLYKKGRDKKMWPVVIYPADWKSEKGYEAIVGSSAELEENTIKTLQKFQVVLQQFPDNIVLKKISQRRMLETLDLSPEELEEVQGFYENPQPQMPVEGQPQQPQGQPMQPPAGPQAPQPMQAPQVPMPQMA